MKKKSRKMAKAVAKKCTLSVTALLALGICVGSPFHANECSAKENAKPAGCVSPRLSIQHEMVPHVVLPETIQYNKVARSNQTLPGISTAGDYGMVSPFVATYTPFPSYQLPLTAEFRTVGQSVYPITPMPKALPLPGKKELGMKGGGADNSVTNPSTGQGVFSSSKTNLQETGSPESKQEETPILLASTQSEVVHATPLEPLNSEVTQMGIFCPKPPKPQTAWSFTSPIFKAASVPMGFGASGQAGYISQYGPRGSQTQVGYMPSGMPMGQSGAEGMMYGGAMPGMPMGMNMGMNAGPTVQMLPNGMLMVTTPPNHARCGLLRCRCGNQPTTMFLPAGPGGMPCMMPSALPQQPGMMPMASPTQAPSVAPSAMLMPSMMGGPQMASPMTLQMMPVTAMTPYGPTLVGYRPMQPMMPQMVPQMTGMGMGMMQAPLLQQLQAQQMQQGQMAAEDANADGSVEPQAPLPIGAMFNPPMGAGMGMMTANPYAMYAQQATQANGGGSAGNATEGDAGASSAQSPMQPPMMFFAPPMQYGMSMSYGGAQSPLQLGGMYMTPFGMMAISPTAPAWGGNGMDMYGAGFGMMNPAMMPAMMSSGMPGASNGSGMSMTDVIQLMMLLNNNQQQRRGLFARLAERREARRERRAGDDPFNMLMQAWTTPYMPYGTVARMPSRSAYPFGYFGAQVGTQETANYGGINDFYMGNTSYPGLF